MYRYLKITFNLFFITGIFLYAGCSGNETGKKRIMVIVENRLISELTPSINQYKLDLENEGYEVVIEKGIDSAANPSRIRELLQDNFYIDENLIGAVMVGNIQAPLFNEIKSQGDAYWHDYLSDLYYMDLDGIWEDTDGDGVFDSHKETNIDFLNGLREKINLESYCHPEIWVSRIRADMLVSLGKEVTLLKNYFRKNHQYRTNKLKLPPQRAFIVSAGLDVLKSGWGARPHEIYSDIDIVQLQKNTSDSLRKFLRSKDGYELGIINVFSGPRIHHFGYFEIGGFDSTWWETREGREQIAVYSDTVNYPDNDISSEDIRTYKPKTLFYHLLMSEAGRHDYPDYIAGTYIFTGLGLAAIAGTQHSGAVGEPIFYESLKLGKTIGDAWIDALTHKIEFADEEINIYWHNNDILTWRRGSGIYKAVLIGDGTLSLPKRKNNNMAKLK